MAGVIMSICGGLAIADGQEYRDCWIFCGISARKSWFCLQVYILYFINPEIKFGYQPIYGLAQTESNVNPDSGGGKKAARIGIGCHGIYKKT